MRENPTAISTMTLDAIKSRVLSERTNKSKTELLTSWLEAQPGNNCDLEYLRETLLSIRKSWDFSLDENWNFDSYDREERLASSWFRNPENNTLANLRAIFPLVRNSHGKLVLVSYFVHKPDNNCDPAYLKVILKALPFEGRKHIFGCWFKKPENNFGLADLKEIFPLMGYRLQGDVILDWLEKDDNNFGLNDLKKICSSVNLWHGSSFIKTWLAKPENNFDFSYLKKILPWVRDKDGLLKSWLAKPENNVDLPYIQKILPSTTATKPLKASLAKSESGFNLDNLKAILPSIDVKDKLVLIKFCLSKITDPHARHDCFVDLAKSDVFGSAYNATQIGAAYTLLNLPKNTIPDLCRDLYPTNELLQVELFKEFIEQEAFKDEQKPLVREFITSITSDQFVLDVVRAARVSESLGLEKQDILELSASRVSEQYQSLAASLKGRELAESLTPAGLTVVAEEFHPQPIPVNTDLAALFSYYNLQEGEAGMVKFKSMLKLEVLKELTEQFVPSGKKPYISKVEKSKLTALLGEEAIAPSFTEIAVLSDYLKSQVPTVPSLNEATIARFSFGTSALIDEEKRDRVNVSFKALLTANSVNEEAVFNFFKNDLKCIGDETTSQNRAKLSEFFKLHKAELAFLFSKENGIDEFVSTISTLADGCAANIGTHFNNALLSSLLKDSGDKSEYNKVLYSVFVEKVVTPFFNTADHVHGGERQHMQGADVLNHPAMKRELLLSPVALVERIKYEFHHEEVGGVRRNMDPTPVLRTGLGDDVATELSSIAGVTPESLSKIATYLVLKHTLPELLENRHLVGFKSSCERAIEASKRSATTSATIASSSTAGGVGIGIGSGTRQAFSEAGVWPSVGSDAVPEAISPSELRYNAAMRRLAAAEAPPAPSPAGVVDLASLSAGAVPKSRS